MQGGDSCENQLLYRRGLWLTGGYCPCIPRRQGREPAYGIFHICEFDSIVISVDMILKFNERFVISVPCEENVINVSLPVMESGGGCRKHTCFQVVQEKNSVAGGGRCSHRCTHGFKKINLEKILF